MPKYDLEVQYNKPTSEANLLKLKVTLQILFGSHFVVLLRSDIDVKQTHLKILKLNYTNKVTLSCDAQD
jgi:hypothetical protein